ncbi:MAG: hypothetical protein A3F46_09100 [Legionellales bacterium RIFCSPHIGHO2_12_FULL_42_9]|nr:MAG: hypothetical protein A3F46_09100 [Legionellales bacterium RIFCSPHIGHO2_12_FULL_42_9]
MSVYMTEEEQLQAIKKWWLRYNTPILVLLSVVMLIVAGYRYWNWHHEKILIQASTVYERLMVSFSEHKNKEIRSYANQLITHYDQTVYADVARMTLAKIDVAKDQAEKAKQLLEDVVNHTTVPAFKQIAKIRIARLLLAQKSFDQALSQLSVIDDNAYMTIVNELKGDIFVEKGDYQHAIKSYRQAISEAKTHGIGNLFLEMKTNELAALTESKNVLRQNIGSV